MLFLTKIIVTPLLVALMSLAAKRFGPTFGGLIMGLPWMTGPVLFVLALEKGSAWFLDAAIGVEFAVVGIAAYILTYGWTVRVLPWWGSLPAASLAFVAVGAVTQQVEATMPVVTVLGMASLLAAYALLPRPRSAEGPRPLPWWDIPARMLATALLVTAIAILSDVLGPQISGTIASFPVILIVVGSFTHHRWGADAMLRLLASISLSLLAFCVFFLVASILLPAHGLIAAYAVAAVAALATSAALIVLMSQVRARQRSA